MYVARRQSINQIKLVATLDRIVTLSYYIIQRRVKYSAEILIVVLLFLDVCLSSVHLLGQVFHAGVIG